MKGKLTQIQHQTHILVIITQFLCLWKKQLLVQDEINELVESTIEVT